MQRKHKKIGLFSLWEVKLVALSLVIMVAAPPAIGFIREKQIERQLAEEARLEAIRQEEERKLWEERQVELEKEREQAAKEEAARIAAGPIVPGTNEQGQEIYTVDYSLGGELVTEGALVEYSGITDLSAYGAFDGEHELDFCFPKNLYSAIVREDKGDVLNTWDVITLSSEDGSRLVTEFMTSTSKDFTEIINNMIGQVSESYQISVETVEQEVTADSGYLVWKSVSGPVAKGVISARGGIIQKLSVICPEAAGAEDGQFKNFYVDSIINMSGLARNGSQTLSWNAYCAQ